MSQDHITVYWSHPGLFPVQRGQPLSFWPWYYHLFLLLCHPCRLTRGQSQQRLCSSNTCANKNCSDSIEKISPTKNNPPKNNFIDMLPVCMKSRIWCVHTLAENEKIHEIFYKAILMLLLFIVCTDRCLGFLLSVSARFQFDLDVCRSSLHIFTPSWSFCSFAEKLFLFRNRNLLKSAGFHSWALLFSSLNYCWYGFLKAANDKSFLWLWSFLSKQSWHRSKWAHSVSQSCTENRKYMNFSFFQSNFCEYFRQCFLIMFLLLMLWVYFVANKTSCCNYYLNCLFSAVLTALEVDSGRNIFVLTLWILRKV